MAVHKQPAPRYWCIWWDPFGLACFIFGLAVVLLVDYVTIARVIYPWFGASPVGVLHAAAFQSLIVLIIVSYLRASMTNPGAVDVDSVRGAACGCGNAGSGCAAAEARGVGAA